MMERLTLEQVLAATERYWDLSRPLPTPRDGMIRCGHCGHDGIQIRYWKWHRREESRTTPYRCDVVLKCTGCGAFWPHGVVVPEVYFEARPFPALDGKPIPFATGEPLL